MQKKNHRGRGWTCYKSQEFQGRVTCTYFSEKKKVLIRWKKKSFTLGGKHIQSKKQNQKVLKRALLMVFRIAQPGTGPNTPQKGSNKNCGLGKKEARPKEKKKSGTNGLLGVEQNSLKQLGEG